MPNKKQNLVLKDPKSDLMDSNSNSESPDSSDDDSDIEELARMSCETLKENTISSNTVSQIEETEVSFVIDKSNSTLLTNSNANSSLMDCKINSESSDSSDDDSDIEELAKKSCETLNKNISSNISLKDDSECLSDGSEVGFVIDKTSNTSLVKRNEEIITTNHSPRVNESASDEDHSATVLPASKKSNKKKRTNEKKLKKRAQKKSGNSHPDPMGLSSRLQVGIDTTDVYVNADLYKTQSQPNDVIKKIHGTSETDQLMSKSVVSAGFEKQHTVQPYQESRRQIKKQRQKERASTKGRGWHDMKAPEMSESDKNDLTLLHMRRALDPKRFYKGPDLKTLPKFYQMGKVVDSPLDFYSSRVPKKERKQTLVDELLADAEFRKFNKRKYAEIVESKAQGRGAYKHMKRLKKRKR